MTFLRNSWTSDADSRSNSICIGIILFFSCNSGSTTRPRKCSVFSKRQHNLWLSCSFPVTVWRERILWETTVFSCRVLFSMNQTCLLAGMCAHHKYILASLFGCVYGIYTLFIYFLCAVTLIWTDMRFTPLELCQSQLDQSSIHTSGYVSCAHWINLNLTRGFRFWENSIKNKTR